MVSPAMISSQPPVTTVIARRARAGKEEEYETWLAGIIDVASRFPGNEGATVLRPGAGSHEYVLIVRWHDFESSRGWVQSVERQSWLAKLAAITEDPGRVEEQSGLETWFTLRPGTSGGPPAPSRVKMAIVTACALYPLLLLVSRVLMPALEGLPWLLRPLVSVAILVPVMTWVVMPQMTRLLWAWLYPGIPRPSG